MEDMEDIFSILLDKGKITFSEPKWPHKVGRIDNPHYCLYHIYISHHIKDCYILKDKSGVLIAIGVITLDYKEKHVVVNTISI